MKSWINNSVYATLENNKQFKLNHVQISFNYFFCLHEDYLKPKKTNFRADKCTHSWQIVFMLSFKMPTIACNSSSNIILKSIINLIILVPLFWNAIKFLLCETATMQNSCSLEVLNREVNFTLTSKQYVDTLFYSNDKLFFEFFKGIVITISW